MTDKPELTNKVKMKSPMKVGMTLYEANQQMYAQTPKTTDIVLNTGLSSIGSWFSLHYKDTHFMLMCKEKSYFTILHFNDMNYQQAKEEVKACLAEQGTLWDIRYSHENDAYECWLRDENDEFHMYYLFDAQPLTIEIGGGNE